MPLLYLVFSLAKTRQRRDGFARLFVRDRRARRGACDSFLQSVGFVPVWRGEHSRRTGCPVKLSTDIGAMARCMNGPSRPLAITALFALWLAACHAETRATPQFEPIGPACVPHQQDLANFLNALPASALASVSRVELPISTIGELPGSGPVLEISEDGAWLDGTPLAGRGAPERALALQARLAPEPSGALGKAPALYVAAAGSVDVQTLRTYLSGIAAGSVLRLLVRMPAAPSTQATTDNDRAREWSQKLLAERDPRERERIAEQAYSEFSRCEGVTNAVLGVRGLPASERWPKLRSSLANALPSCRCDQLSPALQALFIAEQRAGTGTLAALPLAFLRDERCGASMPLRSLNKLLAQMEHFDAEFAGGFQRDALEFEKVLTNERLLNYFCNALPGETLAALARAKATLYWRVPGSESCEGWRFEPLSPGAPMGTWRRIPQAGAAQAPLAFHYWQAAEEVRIFGPLTSAASKPTDEHGWPCDVTLRLEAVDADFIALEHGRWFFNATACRNAPVASELTGCAVSRGKAQE